MSFAYVRSDTLIALNSQQLSFTPKWLVDS